MEILNQGAPQIAHTHHNDPVALIHAQDASDLSAQLVHIIAVALLAELAEAAQVLPDLGGGNSHLLPQDAGGDAYAALQMKIIQIAVVAGKAPDDCIGYVLLFHSIHCTLQNTGMFFTFYYIDNNLSIRGGWYFQPGFFEGTGLFRVNSWRRSFLPGFFCRYNK